MSRVVRMPNPIGQGHRRFSRLGALKSMALGNLEGIANHSYSSLDTLTWETATDWDSSASESGVAHENVTNTDHNDDTIVKQGYRISSPFNGANLLIYYPMHENSGTTANDLSGNGHHGTISGASLGATGLLGTTSYDFDGTDDQISMGTGIFGTGDQTYSYWIKHRSEGQQRQLSLQGDISFIVSRDRGGAGGLYVWDGSWNDTGYTLPTSQWVFIVLAYDSTNNIMDVYADGTNVDSRSFNIGSGGGSDCVISGDDGTSGLEVDGFFSDWRVYSSYLTSSDQQTLYDVVDTPGTLTTATKTFSSPTAPNLQNLDYALNGVVDIQLDVIGSPGAASEEVVTQQLDGGTTYTLSWSNSHTDFHLKLYPDNEGDVTITPTINSLELIAT